MPRPATGTTFVGAGLSNVDNRFQTNRTGLVQAWFRDARGAATNMSPHNSDGSVNFSPLAENGDLRDDMNADVLVNGSWVVNPEPNEGWYIVGAQAEGQGVSTKPSIEREEQDIEQSNWSFDQEITKQREPFSFTALEYAKPAFRRLRYSLPLVDQLGNRLVEAPGALDAGWGQPLDPSAPDRQWLIVSARTRQGKTIYDVDGYDCCRLTNIGDSRRGKKGTAAELTYDPYPSNHFMAMIDGVYQPIIKWTWMGGGGWTDLGSGAYTSWLVTLGAPSAGDFTLTYGGNTTAAIAYTATAAAVKTALVALDDGFEAADWTVAGSAGGPYTVTLPLPGSLTGSGAGLTGGTFSVAHA